ncbi:MAG TPA: ATP-binding protein [Puia sp.]|jgi:PAS domain S-box-containing protein
MQAQTDNTLQAQIEELKTKLEEATQLIQAIKDGEVDAFAIGSDKTPEVYTLHSGDYAYRVLIEEFGEGALNVTQQGLIVYTNRGFLELVGLSYETIIGSNIFDIIAPASAGYFENLFTASLTGKSKGEITLLVNDTEIAVYISLSSLQPNLPTVGIIVTDLTEKKKNESVILQYQNNLEEKNLALMRSNEELASFAYVASHDLQEPLRKIQMFSTRIQDKAQANLSPEVNDYFNRIQWSVKRMQELIRALLEYSRLNISDVGFVSTDLNQLVEEIKFASTEILAENKATVVVSALPVVQAIPHQMNQLFTNLILNAIKYRRPDVDPLITISTQLVDSEDIPGKPATKFKKFWRIQLTDNGIGFEPAFAERIFELFQRLHPANAYEGTGIGLAICRKIMQTHHGYINAEGKLGAGAAFNMYLPLKL